MAMKKLFTLLLLALIISSCASTKKMMVKENYDGIIDKSIKSLIKHPDNEEDAIQLDKAYNLANDRDYSRAKYLRQEGNPNNYDEMFALFESLKNRQDKVKKVLPLTIGGNSVNYPYVDYDAQIIEAKKKAADYYWGNGQKLMKLNTKEGYRQACNELTRAQNYSGGIFPNADKMIEEARFKGISRAIVDVENRTQFRLPDDFEKQVLSFNTDGLNSEWVQYHFAAMDEQTQYDYVIKVVLQSINISPDIKNDKDQMIKKDVYDGFNYALDAKGNVMKDTAGNDIKIPKYKTLTCTLIESVQEKATNIRGEIEFIVLNPDQLLKKEPVGAETRFEFKSARAVGDIGALSTEQAQECQVKPVPFPNDFEMIARTYETLRLAVRDVIYRNRFIIK
jgi:hypothetical protein